MPKLALDTKLSDIKDMLKKKKNPAGAPPTDVETLWFFFEISEFKAKVMQIVTKGTKTEVIDVEKFSSMDESGVEQEMDWPELGAWLQHYVSTQANGRNFSVRVLLLGTNVFIGETENPGVSPKELDDAISWQIADHLPFSSDDSEMQYSVREQNILVSVIQGEFYQKVSQCFQSAKVYPQSITTLPFAYEALIQKENIGLDENLVLVRIGRHHTYVLDFKNKNFQSMREIPFGSEQITEAMMGTLTFDDEKIDISYEQAEVLKKNIGLPTEQLQPDPEEPKNSQLSARIRPVFERLINDINATISAFERRNEGDSVQHVYLAGGGALMQGLDRYFENNIGCKTALLSVDEICTEADATNMEMIGLLYISMEKFNFAGNIGVLKPKFEAARKWMKRGAFAATVVFNFLFIVMLVQVVFVSMHLGRTKTEYENMGASEEKIKIMDNLLDQITKVTIDRRTNIIEEPSLGEAFRELSFLVPRTIVFREMEFQKTSDFELGIAGVVTGGGKSQDIVLSSFLENLDASALFQYSRLESRSTEGQTEGQVAFKILTQLVAA